MSTVSQEDIIGYGIDKEKVCVLCVTAEERDKSNELNYILESETEGIICDRCGKELVFSEQPDMSEI
jgi:hypothetical protein